MTDLSWAQLSPQSKEQRQQATALMIKCACGNVAKLGTKQCSACKSQNNTVADLILCETVEDLKSFMLTHLVGRGY